MSHSLIRQIFDAKIIAWAAAQNVKVAFENMKYDPKTGEVYVKTYLQPASTVSETLSGDHVRYLGVYQVSIVTPLNIGAGKANQLAESLRGVFPIYQPMTKDGFKTQVISPLNIMEGVTGDATYMLPVFFRYRADTN